MKAVESDTKFTQGISVVASACHMVPSEFYFYSQSIRHVESNAPNPWYWHPCRPNCVSLQLGSTTSNHILHGLQLSRTILKEGVHGVHGVPGIDQVWEAQYLSTASTIFDESTGPLHEASKKLTKFILFPPQLHRFVLWSRRSRHIPTTHYIDGSQSGTSFINND